MITNPVTPPSSHRHPVSRVAREWAGRGTYYRIDLEGYQELEPKPRMQEVEAGLSDFILDELETLEPHHYPYMKYGDGFRGRQGVYLARLTPDLYAALSTVAAVLPQTPATSEDPKPETAIAGDFAEGERQKRETTFFKRNPKLRREAIRRAEGHGRSGKNQAVGRAFASAGAAVIRDS